MELIQNSTLNSYKLLNGNRKFTEDDIENDPGLLDAMVNALPSGPEAAMDISMIPGLIDIPICGWDEIRENWSKSSPAKNKNYPCNEWTGSSAASSTPQGPIIDDIPATAVIPEVSPGIALGTEVLRGKPIAAGQAVKPGTKLRILGIGDSITVGYPNDGDGNGYRLQLMNDLSRKQLSCSETPTPD
jgi:hypothetical protein